MNDDTRRSFLLSAAGAGLLLAGCPKTGGEAKSPGEPARDEEVAPPEDLMREHGVLNRILLIYDESARRLDAQQQLPIDVLAKSADLIRRFIEQYHEKLEEDFLFPRFERRTDSSIWWRRCAGSTKRVERSPTPSLRLSTAASVQEENDRASSFRRYGPSRACTVHTRPARTSGALSGAPRVVNRREFYDLGEQFETRSTISSARTGSRGWSCRLERSSRPSVCST